MYIKILIPLFIFIFSSQILAQDAKQDAKAQDAKAQDAKAQDAKAQDAKAQDAKAQNAKAQDAKAQNMNTMTSKEAQLPQNKLAIDFFWIFRGQLKINYERFLIGNLSLNIEPAIGGVFMKENLFDLNLSMPKAILGLRYYNDERDTFIGMNVRYAYQNIQVIESAQSNQSLSANHAINMKQTSQLNLDLLGITFHLGQRHQMFSSNFVFGYRIEFGAAKLTFNQGKDSHIGQQINGLVYEKYQSLFDFELSIGYLF